MAKMIASFWVISANDLMVMLRRVAAGEDPDVVYAEHYANSRVEHVQRDQ